MRLNFLLIIFFLCVSCVSSEQKWNGTVEDFTSSYVEELRQLSVESRQESNLIQYHYQPLIHSIFIQKAEAKTKKKKKKKARRKPASKKIKDKPLVLKTEAVRKIQKSQAKRMPQVDRYKVRHYIGEQENGLLGIRSLDGLGKKESETIKKLVADENKDRQHLYSLIVKSSGYTPPMEKVLRKSFFESYQEWAPVGTYYFKDNKWHKK